MKTSPSIERQGAGRAAWRRIVRDFTLLPVLVVAVIVGAFSSPTFLSERNLINVLQQSSELAIVVAALALILIAGKFDLSLESTFGLAPMVGAWLVAAASVGGSGLGINPYLAMAVCLLIGAAVGMANGLLIVKLGLNAFIVTLAMLILLRGLTLGITSGSTLYNFPPELMWLGSASIGSIPVSIVIALLVYVVGGLFLTYHRTGRAIYAIGGNAAAARAAGIPVERILIGVFVVGGVLAALAGLMMTGRIASVTAGQGQNMIFSAFAAAVIGGISLKGGKGGVFGALTGVLLLAVIANILTLAQVASFWIDACYGAIIIAALVITRLTTGEKDKV